MNVSGISTQFSTTPFVKTVLLTLFLLGPLVLRAQVYTISPDDTGRKRSYLLMRDGTVVRGRVLRQDSTLISVQKRGGNLSFVEAVDVVRITAQPPSLREGTLSDGDDGTSRTGNPITVFVMRDGARVSGTFVKRDSTMITVRKPNGQLTFFEPELLSRVDTIYGGTGGNGVIANAFSPWLLTGQTAYNPLKGRFYYRNTWLVLNEFDYGITSFWSVGGRFSAPFPFFNAADDSNYATRYRADQSRIFTKLSVALTPGVRLGINGSYQASQRGEYVANNYGAWTVQGLLSLGSSQRNVTLGYSLTMPGQRTVLLYAYQPPYSSSYYPPATYRIPNQSLLTLGIMQKLSRNLTLLSDNTLTLGNTYNLVLNQRATVSVALRLDRPRHAFDLGLYSLVNDSERKLYGDPSVRLYPYVGYNLLIGE